MKQILVLMLCLFKLFSFNQFAYAEENSDDIYIENIYIEENTNATKINKELNDITLNKDRNNIYIEKLYIENYTNIEKEKKQEKLLPKEDIKEKQNDYNETQEYYNYEITNENNLISIMNCNFIIIGISVIGISILIFIFIIIYIKEAPLRYYNSILFIILSEIIFIIPGIIYNNPDFVVDISLICLLYILMLLSLAFLKS